MNEKNILIFIPAYNVEKKILTVIERIPNNIFSEYHISILVINDNSEDNTRQIVENYIKNKNLGERIILINNKSNQGYGGVQKIAFDYAIKYNYDYAIMLHGDGQYFSEKIPEFISYLSTHSADAIFGSRMINPKDALKGGMPLYKFIGNKFLTFIQNMILGSNFSEFHSGYRSFKVNTLKKINYKINTNNYHFDTQIMIQFLKSNLKIKEIAIPTFYGDEISHLKSIPYGMNILKTTVLYHFFKK
jgi:glycosyltransferase involved in cell wall biosynthesis|tara:strand:- start:207 stop:944 length:738 start_codon:yes stop_codon:yes gene_type:complete